MYHSFRYFFRESLLQLVNLLDKPDWTIVGYPRSDHYKFHVMIRTWVSDDVALQENSDIGS